MEEDIEFKKLPIEERCVHKLWKARVNGYEEATKIFRSIVEEKSSEWNKFLGLIKKFVTDSNAVAQEKGLEAALVFVENCGFAGKTVGEVIAAIVAKCIGAPKAKTRDLSIQIALMYIEIEKADIVLEELLKGTDHKNPKVSSTCISTITQALKEFGNKVVGIKPLVKKIPTLLADRDKGVREEAKQLTIEIYRWIGPVFKTQLSALPAVVMTELEQEFDKIQGTKAQPTRYLRSQQEKQAAVAQATAENEENEDGDEMAEAEEGMDPMDLIDPVDILSKMPKDFYEKVEAKKWQERKEALESVETLVNNPKLQSGDYGDLVRALKKVLQKDSNVLLVAIAGKCLSGLAKGLAKKFQPYSTACVGAILEKFKEKKSNVVAALRDAIDAIYPSTSLESIQEDVMEALNNKNPSVKSETALFLARSFTKTQPAVLNKKLLKTYLAPLLKNLNESDPTVRDSSAEAVGTAMKLVGEKTIGPFLTEIEALKLAKIKECSEKAVITVKIVGVKKERPVTAPSTKAPVVKSIITGPKSVSRPATATAPVKKSAAVNKKSVVSLAKSASSAKITASEREMSPDEIDEKAAELLPPEILSGLMDVNWKNRCTAVEQFTLAVSDIEGKPSSQVLIRALAKKPGLKDTNLQAQKCKLELLKLLIVQFGITTVTVDLIINDVVEKLGDVKNCGAASQALTEMAAATKLELIIQKVTEFAFEQKSPKVQQESITWVTSAIREFGFQVNPKSLIEDARKAVQSINPGVRSAGIGLLGTMYLYMGNNLMIFFENEKPALKQQINNEIEKYAGQKPPPPNRGISKSSSKSSVNNNDEIDEADDEPQQMNLNDILPRVDISSQITEALLSELADKNWKTRNEGLIKIQGIINEAKIIKPALGDLPPMLALRLVDSNAKIAQTALEICQQISVAMGPASKTYCRVFFPGFLRCLGDGKTFIRSAALCAINTWGEQCGYKEFFEGEMIADAMKTGSPPLKIELWGWMAEKLPNIPAKAIQKDELIVCLPHLYANICDRNADVRKNANDAVLGFMIHLGYETMMKQLDKQKPTSKKDIQAALDKARPNLPVKPLPKSKQQAPVIEETKMIKTVSKMQKPGTSNASKLTAAPAQTSRKKEEEVDLSPLLAVNNIKNQRLLDEQKLKVLKWTFTQPRDEFTDLLKDQMIAANVNKLLLANMFHEDFRYHLKVIDTLSEDLVQNYKGLVCNLDLILKWVSLRFYDTNPSVLLKGLDYLNIVFAMLVENQYMLADNEGSSFIPHLMTKLGDPKDAVRNGVRSLLREICLVYPFTKVFGYVMEALKSKNARQRTECLDELGYLIETYSLTVCQPSPQAALKEIAKHISDRDNSVRNAALNCVVQAYFLTGEKIYKLIGQISEKDLSMLDERIKRSKRTVKKPAEATSRPNTVESQDPTETEELPVEEIVSEEMIMPEVISKQQEHQTIIQQPVISGPFGLDQNVINDIEKNWVKAAELRERQLKASPIDMTFMNAPIVSIPGPNGVAYPTDRLKKLLTSQSPVRRMGLQGSPPTPPMLASASVRSPIQLPKTPENNNRLSEELSPRLDPNLLRIIKGVGSQDPYIAMASVNEVRDIVESPEKQAVMRDYEEIFIQSVLLQFKNLSHKPVNESLALYQSVLHSTYSLFNSSASLGKNLSITNIKNLMSVLLNLMAENKLGNCGDTEYTKVVNGICLKILDRTNFTNSNCALIRLLKETCSSSGLPKFTDLAMKCIWRNVKGMPDRIGELDYDVTLLELHDFMLALPTSWWQQRPSDTPLRTVKTIIHNMTKIKGAAILPHLSRIPQQSELHTYVLKILKNLQSNTGAGATNAGNNNNSTPSPQRSNLPGKDQWQKRSTRDKHEVISNIFKLISEKETEKEGLTKLYDFKIKNTDVDFMSFLKEANPTFQKYIIDGLDEIEKSRLNEGGAQASSNSGNLNRIISSNTGQSNPEFWMDRLNYLKARANMTNNPKNAYPGMIDNKEADENLNCNIHQPHELPRQNVPQISDNISASRLEMLQQKLASLKQKK